MDAGQQEHVGGGETGFLFELTDGTVQRRFILCIQFPGGNLQGNFINGDAVLADQHDRAVLKKRNDGGSAVMQNDFTDGIHLLNTTC